MKLQKIKEALLTVSKKVYHYKAIKPSESYIVWAEDGQTESVWGNGTLRNQGIQGTIDCFTKKENDPTILKIQDALTTAGICFYLNAIQHENETGYIHYEWVWEIDG